MELPQRKNHRLKNYDYGSYGYYYVTICTLNRSNILSDIVGSDASGCSILHAPQSQRISPQSVGSDASGCSILHAPHSANIIPTEIGQKVIECWNNIAAFNENVEVDKFVLMPNHIHGILIISNTEPIKDKEKQFTFEITERRGRRSLQGLIKDFKSVTTRHYKKIFNADTSLWQASFYDEVINCEEHYNDVCQYIVTNPSKWEEDCFFPKP